MVTTNREIWEGWTVGDFIEELLPLFDMIMADQGLIKPFKTKKEVTDWVKDNQPYYKKSIPEVNEFFCNRAGVVR